MNEPYFKVIETKGTIRMSGPVLSCDLLDPYSDCIYPSSVMRDMVKRFNDEVTAHNICPCGCADPSREGMVNLSEITHKIDKLWYNDETNTIDCEVTLLNTPKGQVVKNVIANGGNLGLLLQGICSRVQANGEHVLADGEIYTVNFTTNPTRYQFSFVNVMENADTDNEGSSSERTP